MSSKTASSQEANDAASEEELRREIIRNVRPKGYFLEPGHAPCLCGPEFIKTTKRGGYSDSVIYKHRCRECSNEFVTYIEG
jgi:hypothetical protein